MDRRRSYRQLLACGLACAALAALPSAAAACAGASSGPSAATKRAMTKTTLCLINVQRARRGIRKLGLERRLSRAARRHARDMARRNYFSHTSRSGASFLDRIRRAGYLRGARMWTAGENIGWGSGGYATPRSMVRAWMRSPGHRANILRRRFRQIGIGVAFGTPVPRGAGATYATSFGARR